MEIQKETKTKSKKHPGRKGPKEWRKNVEIESIQDSLVDISDQKRFGGVISEKSNQDLFFIDVARQTNQSDKDNKECKRLRIDEILRPSSGFNLLRTRMPSTMIKKPSSHIKTLAKNAISSPLDSVECKKTNSDLPPIQDIWNNSASNQPITRIRNKSSPIESPQSGISYNPPPEDHKIFIEKVAQEEIAKLKKQQILHEKMSVVIDVPLSSDSMIVAANQRLLSGIDDYGEQNSDSESKMPQELNLPQKNPKVPNGKKKPKTVLNKERRNKIFHNEQILKRKIKDLTKSVADLPGIIDQLKQKEATNTGAGKNPTALLGKARLGRLKYKPLPMPFKLPDELPNSLRELSPEGNLLAELFNSLQRRSIIEPRIPTVSKRTKCQLKRFERHSYKDFK